MLDTRDPLELTRILGIAVGPRLVELKMAQDFTEIEFRAGHALNPQAEYPAEASMIVAAFRHQKLAGTPRQRAATFDIVGQLLAWAPVGDVERLVVGFAVFGQAQHSHPSGPGRLDASLGVVHHEIGEAAGHFGHAAVVGCLSPGQA
ncbi:MAG: hypothetical protein AB7S38_12620 [Vulcanimicrobiota bacterium]